MNIIWQELLFRPLLNLLIGLYNTIGLQNLGLSIIWLTIIIRIILLPLFLQDRKSEQKHKDIEDGLEKLQKTYANNPTVLREEQRALFKKLKLKKWPKIITLGIQVLVFIILYQVFIGGVHLDEIVDFLYPWITIPVDINSVFLGVDIAKRSFILTFLCGLLLFINIYQNHKKSNTPWTSGYLLYIFAFPGFTFLILWYLPAVKAVFILTTMLFSNILEFQRNFRMGVKEQNKLLSKKKEEIESARTIGVPHPNERFK